MKSYDNPCSTGSKWFILGGLPLFNAAFKVTINERVTLDIALNNINIKYFVNIFDKNNLIIFLKNIRSILC
jgi:hypothetical protein